MFIIIMRVHPQRSDSINSNWFDPSQIDNRQESEFSISYDTLKLMKKTDQSILKKATGLCSFNLDGNRENPVMEYLKGLRQVECAFLIAVTMYNESFQDLEYTLKGVAKNLIKFEANGVNPDRVACVVIVDGIEEFMKTFSNSFTKFFDPKIISNRFNATDLNDCVFPGQQDHDEFAHVFCHYKRLGNFKFPLKLIFCVKQLNRGKLNSHLWFFGGFCEEIKPKYVMLLDVGTKPRRGSLFYLYEAMSSDKNLAGCCGEIKPNKYDLLNIVLQAQHVEYKFAHMLDKALESVIGYITVLPGAFSAYNWEALQGDLLWEDYFKPFCNPLGMDAYQSNIYLAEDRVLCMALVTKKGHNYTLRYVKKSVAKTDVPGTISDLLKQRRRWINGSWFALVKSVGNIKSIWGSNHNTVRKCCFSIQMIYYILSVIYTWFIVGGFCLALSIILRNFFYDRLYLADILLLIYLTVIILIFIASLGVKPEFVEDLYKGLSIILGCYQILAIYIVVYFLQANINFLEEPETATIILAGSVGLLALIIIVNCEIITILKGIIHYIFLIPTYVNIFFIYSICNVDDCTWGNRPDKPTKEEIQKSNQFKLFRTRWTIIWAISNSGFAYGMNRLDKEGNMASSYFLITIALLGLSVVIIRILGGILYLFDECFKGCKKNDRNGQNPASSVSPPANQHLDQQINHQSSRHMLVDDIENND